MSSSLSDVEDQPNSASSCFRFIPSRSEHEQIASHSNPDSSFYVIKNPDRSSSRSGNPRTVFRVIHPVQQDTLTKSNFQATSSNRLLIKGGRIVNDDGTTTADVFIEDGVIKYNSSLLFFLLIC